MRERDLFDRQVWIYSCLFADVGCLRCGRVGEHYRPAPLPAPALTRRMQCWIEALVRYLPSAMSASSPGVGWHTIRRSTSAVCRPVWAPPSNFWEVRRLVMDEFALHRGHRYATVIMRGTAEFGKNRTLS